MKSTQFDPATLALVPYPVDPERITPGTETTAALLMERADGTEIRAVWQMTPGVLEGVEGDEMFVVMTGRATVQFADGRVWELGPGDVGIVVAGDIARWTVHETLRKVLIRRL